jgi:hypothetical protein
MPRGKEKRKKESVVSDVRLKPAGQVQVVPTRKASQPPPDKRIHPRRPLPLVPEGPKEDDDDQ